MTRRTLNLFLAMVLAACGANNGTKPTSEGKVGSFAQALTSCPGSSTVSGIDVSSYQGSINWGQVKSAGVTLAYVKATEGTNWTDPTFGPNWSGTKGAGVIRGAYHFFHPGEDPVAQADFFVQTMGTLQAGDLPPMIDWEVTDGVSAGTNAANGLAFLQRVQQLTGRVPILYTDPGYWYGLGTPAGFSGYPLFVADYGVNCPSVPAPWSGFAMWQTGSSGAVAGVGGQVDTDIFNGTLAGLLALGGAAPAKPALPPTSKIQIVLVPGGNGYWLVQPDGGVFAYGGASFFGSMGGQTLNAPVVGLAATPDGKGYFLVGADGGIFAFGSAVYQGSLAGQALNAPIVGIAVTLDGKGYWLVGADGGVFSFGSAVYHGSMGGQSLNAPVVGMAATPDGEGYWLVGADGGVFNFGSAGFDGSMGGTALNAPVVAMVATPDGQGYWLVGADGGVFNFGSAGFFGSEGGGSSRLRSRRSPLPPTAKATSCLIRTAPSTSTATRCRRPPRGRRQAAAAAAAAVARPRRPRPSSTALSPTRRSTLP